jgi:hypothetical protein
MTFNFLRNIFQKSENTLKKLRNKAVNTIFALNVRFLHPRSKYSMCLTMVHYYPGTNKLTYVKNAKKMHFCHSGGKMQKDPQKHKYFIIFDLRSKNNFLDIFRHRSPYMNFEINRPLIHIRNATSYDAKS